MVNERIALSALMRWGSPLLLVIIFSMVACTSASESEVRHRLLTTLATADADKGLTPSPIAKVTPSATSASVRATAEATPTAVQTPPLETTPSPTYTAVSRASNRPRAHEIRIVLEKDAIPAILEPKFLSVAEAVGVYHDEELVLGVEINGEARAYSIAWLSRVEIVNDVVGGQKIAATW